MFCFFSQVKAKRFFFAGLVLVLLAAILGGCNMDGGQDDAVNIPGTLPSGLVGKWVTAYDSFEITRSAGRETIKNYYGSTLSSEGTIEFVANYDSSSGVIIVKYTSGATNPNKPFGAIYYLNFTASTVSLNSAWDATATDYDANTATLNEAREKFTQGNMGNYIDVSYAATYTREG